MAAGRQSHSFASPTGRLQEDMYFNYGCIFKQHPHLPAVWVHSCCDLCAQAWQWAWLLGHLIAEGSDSLRCLVHILRNVPNACHQVHASGGLLECSSSARIPRNSKQKVYARSVLCQGGDKGMAHSCGNGHLCICITLEILVLVLAPAEMHMPGL